MKKVLLIVIILGMTIMLLIYPQNCLESAKRGLNLWFSAVLPSLLPFMVASFILLETGIVRLIAHVLSPATRVLFAAPGESAYVFIASAFSGYPMGAKLASELYAKEQITKKEAQHIIRFTSVSGPVFITGAVSAGMLGIPEAGVYLAVTHYISALLVGIILGRFNKKKVRNTHYNRTSMKDALHNFKQDIAKSKPLGEILALSVEKAIWTLLKVGGFIIFFSVVIELLSATGVMNLVEWIYSPFARFSGMSAQSTSALLYGGIEMTTGCNYATSLNISITQKLPVIASIIAFGGMCIHMQTKSVCMGSGLKPKGFVFAKSLQAMFAYLLCWLSLILFPITVTATNIQPETKTAAYYGIVFAAVSIILLFIIKHIQKTSYKKSSFTLSRKL